MKTCCKSDGTTTSFIFQEVDPKYEEAIRNLYYLPSPDGYAKSFPADTPHLDHIYDRFARYAQEIVLQATQEHVADWQKCLENFLEIIKDSDINWCLVGSAALSVRGIDVTPHDVDIVVDDAGAFELNNLLADHLIEPLQLSSGWIWNAFGRAFLGARFEWIGGVNESADQPVVVDFGPTATRESEIVNWRGIDIKVPPLELQLQSAERRKLDERAAKIRRYLALKDILT
jgi:hypothetical protein